jgi:hypothetical protein
VRTPGKLLVFALAALVGPVANAQSPAPIPEMPIPVQRPAPPAPGTIEMKATGVPGQATASRLATDTATITALDVGSRTIALKRRSGETQTFKVGPDVTRLEEFAVGDVIKVEYEQGLALEFQPAGTESVPMEGGVTAGRSGRDQLPGGVASAGVQGTVTVTAIETAKRLVSFQAPGGVVYQVKAGPTIQLEKLKVGDRLLATYVETVAISLQKMPKVLRKKN